MLIFTVEIECKNSPTTAETKAAYLREKENLTKEVNKKSPSLDDHSSTEKIVLTTKGCRQIAERAGLLTKPTFFSKEMYRLIASCLLDMPMDMVCRKMDALPEVEREALTVAIWDEYHERCSPLKPL
ncbi:MAG: hypothetical protein E7650_02760 [Ruminococcaceae bacterium]|nr:hypothetical protein [Oscillospiraceae bacterium]